MIHMGSDMMCEMAARSRTLDRLDLMVSADEGDSVWPA